MSYCRWSSMDHACDLYVYADVSGGYTCHVASNRRVADTPCPPMPPEWWKLPVDEGLALYNAQNEWVEKSKLVPIGLPNDGETFSCLPRDSMVEKLKELKAEGYIMPDDLIETIAAEDDEE